MNITKKESRLNMMTIKNNLFRLSMVMMAIVAACPMVFATDHSAEVITAILSVVFLIMNVLGIIFVIIGFVKLVISHAQEDAPGQQKAAMFIATGLVLIIARLVMNEIDFADWIDTDLAG